jgi:predicted trehalose synthase
VVAPGQHVKADLVLSPGHTVSVESTVSRMSGQPSVIENLARAAQAAREIIDRIDAAIRQIREQEQELAMVLHAL